VSKAAELRSRGDTGDDTAAQRLSATRTSLRSLRTARKEMARVHEVNPHQCKS